MRRTPAVYYCSKKIKITNKTLLLQEWSNVALSAKDFQFLTDVINGLTLAELAEKHKKSVARIAQWKRRLFERLLEYDMAQVTR